MNNQFKVSVIIPVFNAARFLEKAVASCLNIEDVAEILLIEDGSSDNSLQICKELESKHKIVKVFQHPDKKNHNAAATRNLGVVSSSSEFIAFLDADDFYLPERFKTAKEIIINDDSTDGVYEAISSYAYDAEGKKQHEQRMKNINTPELNGMTTLKEPVEPESLFETLIKGKHGWFHFDGLVLRKRVFKRIGLLDERLRFGQDTEFFFRLALMARLVPGRLKTPVACRGVYAGNMTLTSLKKPTIDHKNSYIIISEKLYRWMLQKEFSHETNRLIFRRYLESNNLEKKSKYYKIYLIFKFLIKDISLFRKLI